MRDAYIFLMLLRCDKWHRNINEISCTNNIKTKTIRRADWRTSCCSIKIVLDIGPLLSTFFDCVFPISSLMTIFSVTKYSNKKIKNKFIFLIRNLEFGKNIQRPLALAWASQIWTIEQFNNPQPPRWAPLILLGVV